MTSTTPSNPRFAPATKRKLVTAAIIGLLVVAVMVLASGSTKPKIDGDVITQTFSQGEPCATATIALKSSDADPRDTAQALFDAIRPVAGLTSATYNIKTSSIDIGFCESQSNEAALRQALAPTGFVAE